MDENNHQTLNPIYLWIPLWCGFIALAFVLQKHYLSDTDINFDAVSTPVNKIIGGKPGVEIYANSQGHYLFKGRINNKPVNFLLDTGATFVAIPESVAAYLKLRKGNKYIVNTANGNTHAFATLLSSVDVGNLGLNDIEGVIVPAMQGNNILLGMSFLKALTIIQEQGKISLSLPVNSL